MELSKVQLLLVALTSCLVGLSVSTQTIKEGEAVTIPCEASMPKLLRRTWAKGHFTSSRPPSHNDLLFVLVTSPGPLERINARADMTVDNQTAALIIGDVRFEDGGFYTCISENYVGVREYAQTEDYVVDSTLTIDVPLGGFAEIQWNMDGNNDNLVRLWLKGKHTDLPTDDDSVIVRQVGNELPDFLTNTSDVLLRSFSLIILSARHEDGGYYTALQMNEHGEVTYRIARLLVHGSSSTSSPTTTTTVPTTTTNDCQEVYDSGKTTSGVYQISPDGSTTIDVYCEQELDNGGWTVFQRRMDGSVDFYRGWTEYQTGFGTVNGEHWIGNDNLHLLTSGHDQKLKVELEYKGEVVYADYSSFWISDASDKYRLQVSGFSGAKPPGESLIRRHNGRQFTTKDQDNDPDNRWNCAEYMAHGAWWYEDCFASNLNGVYGDNVDSYWNISWDTYQGYKAMSATRMMVKRR